MNSKRQIYLKENSQEALRDIQRLVLDFDGVIVQTKDSFRKNIVRVVDYYFHDIMGLDDERSLLIDLGDVQDFKDSGMFNNDWNLTYAFILYHLAAILRLIEARGALPEFWRRFGSFRFRDLPTTVNCLKEVGGYINSLRISTRRLSSEKSDTRFGLSSFLSRSRGGDRKFIEESIETFLPEPQDRWLSLIKEMALYKDEGSDIVKRLFEESYLGIDLFKTFHKTEPFFNFEESFMLRESFIPTVETLETLKVRFGPLLIYSERTKAQALYHLRRSEAVNFFSENMIFFDDILELEKSLNRSLTGQRVQLGKPDPTVFLNLLKRTSTGDFPVAYVGDTIADALMVENAKRRGRRNLLFFGLICSSHKPNRLVKKYKAMGVDVIATDMNDLPLIFASLEEWKGGEA